MLGRSEKSEKHPWCHPRPPLLSDDVPRHSSSFFPPSQVTVAGLKGRVAVLKQNAYSMQQVTEGVDAGRV